MRCLSVCVGFKSIISACEWRVSRTTSREIPAGSGVMVVKIVLAMMNAMVS